MKADEFRFFVTLVIVLGAIVALVAWAVAWAVAMDSANEAACVVDVLAELDVSERLAEQLCKF